MLKVLHNQLNSTRMAKFLFIELAGDAEVTEPLLGCRPLAPNRQIRCKPAKSVCHMHEFPVELPSDCQEARRCR
jgi:hypothetical protein